MSKELSYCFGCNKKRNIHSHTSINEGLVSEILLKFVCVDLFWTDGFYHTY